MGRAEDLYGRLTQGGETEINNFIAQQVTEELFLDYKRSADNGAGTVLNGNDKNNLAKAISGFGNSEGGVIVWGVDCRNVAGKGDVPTGAVPIENPIRFKSWLEQATSGLTVPAHAGVQHCAIPDASTKKGFVLSLIPSGVHAPYQMLPDLSYYIRAGSNFVKAPHAVLAGMFGRRPQPSVKHHYFVPKKPTLLVPGVIETQIGIMIENYGLGIAENMFLNFALTNHPGSNCRIEFLPSEEKEAWWGRMILNHKINLVARTGYVLPPEAAIMPLALKIHLKAPLDNQFTFEGTCGATGAETWKFKFERSVSALNEAYHPFVNTPPSSSGGEAAAEVFNKIFYEGIL